MKIFKTQLNSSSTDGFTLVETLVAIVILLIAISGPLTLPFRNKLNADLAKEQIVANFLAQDALEYVIAQKRQTWLNDFVGCTGSSVCRIDTTRNDVSGAVEQCGSNGCGNLQLSTSGLYGYEAGWDDSRFIRTINITEIEPDQEAVVTVTVEWKSSASIINREFVVKTNIFNSRF